MSRDGRIAALAERALETRLFPGCVVGYVRRGQAVVKPFGRLSYEVGAPETADDTVYDVASITKSIPTAALILKLAEQGHLGLDDPVVRYLPELSNAYRERILIRHLLTFTVSFDIGEPLAAVAKREPERLVELVMHAPVPVAPGERYLYTNAPSLLLGMIAERISDKPLDELARGVLFGQLGMERTTFRPQAGDAGVAPSALEADGEVRGVAHDPAARALIARGRVPGHAGLFSTAPDLLRFAQMLLGGGKLDDNQVFKAATVRSMSMDQTSQLGIGMSLGWSLRRPEFMGSQVSSGAFGKTGFTGCVIVVDPIKKRAMVVLSNRTYPEPSDWGAVHRFMAALSDVVFAA